MKSVKMLGLTVAAVLALTAVAAASSASAATVLCKENTSTCKSGSIYSGGTAIEANLKSGTTSALNMSSFIGNQTCTGSTLTAKTIHKEGTGMPVEVTGLTFSGCSGKCGTATGANLPYSGELSKTTGGNGTLTLRGSGEHGAGIKMTACSLGVSCVFTGTINLAFEGGTPAKLVAKEASLTRESGSEVLCGNTASFSATYELSKPSPTFATGIESREIKKTALCRESAEPCTEGKNYTAGNLIKAENAALTVTFNGLGSTLATCSGSNMEAELLAAKGEPSLPIGMKFLNLGTCTTPCTFYGTSFGSNASVEAIGGGDGRLKVPLTVTFKNCTVAHWECVYSGEVQFEFQGDSQAQLAAKEAELKIKSGEGNFCGTTAHLTATPYTVTNPSPVFVTEAS